jgi:hypothetical protein
MKYVYLLQHSFEYEYKGELFEETKIIGIFSTKEKAEKIISHYSALPGFKDHPLECFYLDRYELNKNFWEDGFIKV